MDGDLGPRILPRTPINVETLIIRVSRSESLDSRERQPAFGTRDHSKLAFPGEVRGLSPSVLEINH